MTATLPADPLGSTDHPMPSTASGGAPPARTRRAPWGDALFATAAHLAAWVTLALLAGIIVSLVMGAWPAERR